MKNQGTPILVEGIPFLLIAVVVAIGFMMGGLWPVSLVFWAFAIYTVFFFRNPERLIPVGAQRLVSPADGRVIVVTEATEPEFLKEPMIKISIFMSLWDVHANRFPIEGTVKDSKYHKGRFMAAFEDKASEENERNAILIQTPTNQKVVLVQVAGLVARRIVCYPGVGSYVLKGQRMGLIRFGSRCDLYLPKSSSVKVKVGDKLLGGESIVAELSEGAA